MPKSSGLAYKKMANEKNFGPASKYDKGVQSDVTRPITESLTKASARTGLKPKEPADLWHHYDSSIMDVNAGIKTPMVKTKK